jgi:hypothetical protein
MPELYEQNALWVDDSDDEQDFLLEMVEESSPYMVDEDEAMSADDLVLVEEEDEPAVDMRIPGSDVQYVEDQPEQKEEKITDWDSKAFW